MKANSTKKLLDVHLEFGGQLLDMYALTPNSNKVLVRKCRNVGTAIWNLFRTTSSARTAKKRHSIQQSETKGSPKNFNLKKKSPTKENARNYNISLTTQEIADCLEGCDLKRSQFQSRKK